MHARLAVDVDQAVPEQEERRGGDRVAALIARIDAWIEELEAQHERDQAMIRQAPPDRMRYSSLTDAYGAHGTDQQELARRATASEARLAAIIGSAMDAIVTVDAEQHITVFNAAAERMFGIPTAEAIGRPLTCLMPEHFRAQHAEHMRKFAQVGTARQAMAAPGTVIGLRATGEEFPIEATISQVEVNGEQLFTAILRDVTEAVRHKHDQLFLMEASAALNETLDRDRVFAELAQLAVIHIADCCAIDLIEPDGSLRRRTVAQRTSARLDSAEVDACSYASTPPASHPLARALYGGRSTLISRICDAAGATVRPDDAELAWMREHSLSSYICVPLAANDHVLGAISFAAASERSLTEAELALAEELGQRAGLAIENARLYGEVQHALEVRDDFLSIAAHELKRPLTPLVGAVQLAQTLVDRQPEQDTRMSTVMGIAVDATRQLTRLIDALVDLSRLERGQLQLDRQTVDLAGLAQRIVRQCEPPTGHTIELKSRDEALLISGDEDRLALVLYNLIQNAIKYSPNGGAINVTLDRSGDRAILTVSDEGIGIPEEAQARIFERFYRAGNTTGSRIGGMGIGLYLVKEIVELHSGAVEVASMEGHGSTFSVTLPLAGADAHHVPAEV